ncbi:MAG: uroporphyrinogen decarboxylase family protein, partial [Candidatus Bipolaricaulia bacterium]
MNHRERVLQAINHKEPDRVPIDIGGMRSTGMHAITYKKLRTHLDLDSNKVKLYDVWQQLAKIDDDILEKFNADVKPLDRLAPAFGIKIDKWKEGELSNGSSALVPKGFNPVEEEGIYRIKDENGHTLARRQEDSLYYDTAGVHHPLANCENAGEVKSEYTRQEISEEEKEYLRRKSEELRETTDRAIIVEFGGSIYEQGQLLRGYKQWYKDLAGNKKLVKTLLDLLVEDHLENLNTFIEVLGDNIDIIAFGGDDLGMQDAPQISPQTYRDLFKPRHKAMWSHVKKKTDWKVFLHSCGSIYQLIPDLIDAGLEIINPVHINAVGMEPEKLKKEFGKKLVFWGGGCDTQNVLPNGTPE